MRKVLYILGQLTDLDVEWLARNGLKRRVAPGTELVRQGERTRAVRIVLEGQLTVAVRKRGRVATIGVGEMIGELSFIDSAPPSATVTAETECVVLELDKDMLTAKLRDDEGFGQRFYRAIALFLADRLRGTMEMMGYGDGEGAGLDSEDTLEDELDETILDGVSLAGDRFDRLLRTLSGARTA